MNLNKMESLLLIWFAYPFKNIEKFFQRLNLRLIEKRLGHVIFLNSKKNVSDVKSDLSVYSLGSNSLPSVINLPVLYLGAFK